MLDLEEIKKRCEAAVPGPWQLGYKLIDPNICTSVYTAANGDAWGWMVADCDTRAWTVQQSQANAEFIAHAREDVPALVAEVERLRAEIWAWRDEQAETVL